MNGTEGRLELDVVERAAVLPAPSTDDRDDPADASSAVDPSALGEDTEGLRGAGDRLVLQRHFEQAQEIPLDQGAGAHGGGDARMLAEVFRGRTADPLGRSADWRDGLRAISVGICANVSLETGAPVEVGSTLGLDLHREPR